MDKDTNKRTERRFEFYYNGWKSTSNNPSCVGKDASRDNIFPHEKWLLLDADLLKKMGLTKKRMGYEDALFFYQLILPFVDLSKLSIEGNPRKAFYTTVSKFTNS